MARGFESKSVADQQAEAEEPARRGGRERRRNPIGPRRRGLELARADALHRLEQTTTSVIARCSRRRSRTSTPS